MIFLYFYCIRLYRSNPAEKKLIFVESVKKILKARKKWVTGRSNRVKKIANKNNVSLLITFK